MYILILTWKNDLFYFLIWKSLSIFWVKLKGYDTKLDLRYIVLFFFLLTLKGELHSCQQKKVNYTAYITRLYFQLGWQSYSDLGIPLGPSINSSWPLLLKWNYPFTCNFKMSQPFLFPLPFPGTPFPFILLPPPQPKRTLLFC